MVCLELHWFDLNLTQPNYVKNDISKSNLCLAYKQMADKTGVFVENTHLQPHVGAFHCWLNQYII